VRRAHDARDRGSGQQQEPGEEQEHEEDVGADLLEERAGHPVQPLAQHPAVVAEVPGIHEAALAGWVVGAEPERPRREPQHQRAHQAGRPGPERAHRRQHRLQHEERPRAEQQHRCGVAHTAEQEDEPVGHGLTDLPAVPAQVEHEREEGRERHQAEADQVEMLLLDLRQARAEVRGAPGAAPGLAAGAAASHVDAPGSFDARGAEPPASPT
jgi:hypothetical protein